MLMDAGLRAERSMQDDRRQDPGELDQEKRNNRRAVGQRAQRTRALDGGDTTPGGHPSSRAQQAEVDQGSPVKEESFSTDPD